MSFSRRLVGAAALSAMLAACGGGDSDNQEPSGTDIFPLAVGNRWEMEYVDSRHSSYTRTYEVVTASQAPGGLTSYVMRQDGAADNDETYQHPNSGVYRILAGDATETRIQLPLVVGNSWVDAPQTHDYVDLDGDGINEVATTTASGRVDTVEEIETPAGKFKNSYRITRGYHTEVRNAVTGELYEDESSGSSVRTENYVVGVGLVYRRTQITPAGGPFMFTSEEKLSAYRVASN